VAWIADVVLVVHALFVAFVVGGLAFIWLGAWRGWQSARNLRFRVLHLCAIVVVALEAIAGIACPLTVWENRLRGGAEDPAFIERWVGWLIYYDLPPWVFTVSYLAFALVVAATLVLVPPHLRSRNDTR